MCTAVISIDPSAADPVLLLGVRDEFRDRAWNGPAAWWPREFPGLVGGRDLLAGGTWLAVDPARRALGCVLNGHGAAAPEQVRSSRGRLPLLAAAGAWRPGDPAAALPDPSVYDPFHLVAARLDAGPAGSAKAEAWLYSWDGAVVRERRLEPGLHLVVNSGLAGLDEPLGRGGPQMAARIAHFRPLFEAAKRPEPSAAGAETAGSAAAGLDTAAAWGDWLALAQGAGLTLTDPRALILAREFADGRRWGTSSVSLVALGSRGVRYDFSGAPADPETWQRIL